MKEIFNLENQLTSNDYKLLIFSLIGYAPYFSLVTQDPLELSLKGKEILKNLSPFLVSEGDVTEWPGTKLYHGTAKNYVYKLSQESASILLNYTNDIFDWGQPDLPEDLCLLRDDYTALFVSISHENDVYFELTSEDVRMMDKLVPTIKLRPQNEK